MTFPPDNPFTFDSTTPQPSPPRDIRDVRVGELFDAMMEQAVVTFRDSDAAEAADMKDIASRFLMYAKQIATECPDLNIRLSFGERLDAAARRLDVKA